MIASVIFIKATYIILSTMGIFIFFIAIHFALINPTTSINVPGGSLVASMFNPYSAYYYAFEQLEISIHYGRLFKSDELINIF